MTLVVKCSAIIGGFQDNCRDMSVNHSKIEAQSLDYCTMIVEFDDKFNKCYKCNVNTMSSSMRM